MALKVINSLRLCTERFVMAFLKVEIDFGPKPTNLPQATSDTLSILECFMPRAYFKIQIEPTTRVEEFTADELKRIAEFIVSDNYFAPFNKFFYQVISGKDHGDALCTVFDYIDQKGLEVEIIDPQKVGEGVTAKNPIHQVIDFYLNSGP